MAVQLFDQKWMFITQHISIDEREIKEEFILGSGPGGQNINKVATGVQLRFDVAHSPSLPEDVRKRLITLAGRRITSDGELIIESKAFRSQRRNRQEARRRLVELIQHASKRPKLRKKSQPPEGSRERRLSNKRLRGDTKKLRQKLQGSDIE